MNKSAFCYLGLGSNLDNPQQHIRQTIIELDQLPHSQLINVSALYRSKPVGPQDQDDFVNAVACLQTELPPLELLDALQALEQKHRRVRERHWGPRTLDLDILLYGEQQIHSERLTVPHPFMCERAFVLVPLADIAPGLTLPGGQNLNELAANCERNGLAVIPHH
ncbi:2-amino-4-hydroxy-6-hydroxymethyldihydropteridine diphosphokinase [Gilvimarinus chinensis]|uniref:2-amino-4-hydroxy-6- hydroxymethyldihydropteridine diphosphokinase n=1 Tax=Gilvimarinus chinensis TaxID=396005 RepID=UPI00037C3106|nr:2-amino-4-hydroxy-6-hydroxymethyldihydropteridine diphosphokinase [Gilvimarinus chinensis]